MEEGDKETQCGMQKRWRSGDKANKDVAKVYQANLDRVNERSPTEKSPHSNESLKSETSLRDGGHNVAAPQWLHA